MKHLSTIHLQRGIYFCIAILLLGSTLSAQTNVSGNVQGNWTKALSPYKVAGNIVIPTGQTLAIDPGVEVQFASGSSQITVQGTLKAEGTSSDSIKFTGLAIGFQNNTGPLLLTLTSNTSMKFVKVSGLATYYNTDNTPAFIIRSSSCVIQNCSFLGMRGTAVELDVVGAVITNNVFSANTNLDINLTVDNLTYITGNGALKVGVLAGMTADATLVSGNLYYKLLGNLTIPLSKTLTVSPGVEVQFTTGVSRVTVQGNLKAEGTVSDSIKFMNYALGFQDNAGPIVVESTSSNTSLKYVKMNALAYYYNTDNTAVLVIRSSSCIIQNCSLQNIRGTGIQFDNAAPSIKNNAFSTINMDVILTVDNLPKLVGNGKLKIGVLPGMVGDAVLTTNNLYYKLLGNFTVPPAKTLIINAGAEVQFTSGVSQVTVQGTLKAEGTATDSIKFTGLAMGFQDNVGPVTIESTSVNTSMKYITFSALGYYYNTDNTAALIVRSSSCKIQNCKFLNIRGTGVQIGNASPVIGNNFFLTTSNLDAILDLDKVALVSGNGSLKIGLTANAAMTSNDTLTSSNSFYRLLINQTIPATKRLTIQPGVELQFPNGTSQLTVQGILEAKGLPNNYIKFIGGPLSFQSQRGPVIIESTSVNSSLQFVTIDSLGVYYNSNTTPLVIVKSTSCSITNCIFENTNGVALAIQGASPVLTRACFYSNSNGAVLSSGGSAKFIHSNFVANNSFSINNTSTNAADIITATNCWWGNISGPKQATTNPGGFGDMVSDKVLYNPWSTTSYDCGGVDVTLPISLLDFTATQLSNSVSCNWRTATETNSSYFIVQRSDDANTYLDLATITASGNSVAQTNYQFVDRTPANGINYYRLKMVDKDGKFTFSSVVEVTMSNQRSVVVYPNPAREKIFVHIQKNKAGKTSFEITDTQGKVLLQLDRPLPAGSSTISIDVSGLVKGIYILVLKGDEMERKIFVKE